MSADKYPSIFSRKMDAVAYIYNKKIVYRECKKSSALCSDDRTKLCLYRQKNDRLQRNPLGLGKFVR